jgi:hypothetical protein
MRRVHLALALIAGLALLVSAPTVLGQAQGPDTVILTGSPMGGVKFEHKKHGAEFAAGKCETCHHPSKPEKAATSPNQKCSECHTKAAAAPMKTKYQAAFHNPLAKEGTCITCHTEQNKAGKAAPTKCTDCHKKENK